LHEVFDIVIVPGVLKNVVGNHSFVGFVQFNQYFPVSFADAVNDSAV
jgi:hypothetical protein